MFFSMHPDPHLLALLFFLSSLIHNAWSLGIEFQTPAGGATWPAGPITVQWGNAGGSPDMSDLTTYILDLIVGGNSADDSQVVQTISTPGVAVSDGKIAAVIDASSAQSIQNGFYLRMTSRTKDNNQAVNYSDRFTLINMKGATESQYLEGANAAAGSVSNVPEAVFSMVAQTSTTTTSSSTSTTSKPSTTTSSQSTAPPISDNSDDSGISGVTLGIAIAGSILALIGVVSIVLWVLFFYRRLRRKREEARPKKTQDDPAFLDNKTELAAYRLSRVVSTSRVPVEMDAGLSRQELSAEDKAVEAPASPMVYELEGDMSAWEAGSGRRSKAWEAV